MANTTNSPSGNVDEHVVKMTFDNKEFEKNAQQSLNTVEKLKSSMNFEATVKGLDKLEDGVTQTNKSLSSLDESVSTIQDRFSNLGIIGVTALQNITNSAINLGKQMIKSLTITPIKSGFDEYELKMNSMKTIVASTRGEFKSEKDAIKSVNAALNELNKYSDETIYSFSDMTNNIGKFTNAGVKLNDAVNAIKGVSSEAALAGANANEASRAMYNFSQALSAGYVKLIDWKSIENANMATQDFKNNLLQTAEALGTVKKQGDMYVSTTKNMNGKTSQAFNATKNFNDSLAHQWMTNKVLTTTLKAYATDVTELSVAQKKAYEQELKRQGFNEKQIKNMEDLGHRAMLAAKEINTFSKMVDTLQEAVQSSWAATSEYIFGTLDQAKKLWTSLEQSVESVIMAHNNLRNDILSDWNQLGGRSELIKGFKSFGSAIASIFKPIRQAFLDVFRPFDEKGGLGKRLYEGAKRFSEFAKSIKLTTEESNNLKETFRGLFLIVERVGSVIKAVGSTIWNIIKTTLRPIIDIVLKIGSALTKVIQIVDYVARVIGTSIKIIYDYFIGIDNTIQFFKNLFNTVVNAINKGLDKVNQWLGKITGSTIKSGKAATTIGDIVIKVIRAIYKALVTIYYYGLYVVRGIVIAVGAVGITVAGAVSSLVSKLIKLPAIKKLFSWLDKQFTVTTMAAEKNNNKISKSSKSTAEDIQKNWNKLSFKDKALIVLASVVEKLKEGFVGLINFAKEGFGTIKGFFINFANDVKTVGLGKAILNAFKTIGQGFVNLLNKIKDGFKRANIPQPIKDFFAWVENAFKTVKSAISDFFDFLSSKFPIAKKIQDFFKKLKDSIKNLFGIDSKASSIKKAGDQVKDTSNKASGLKSILNGLASAFKKVGSAIKNFMASLDGSKIFTALLSGILLFSLASISRLIWKLGNQTEVVTKGFLTQLGNLTGSLNTFVKGVNAKLFPTQKTFVLRIREMAEAVAILAGSVVILSTINSQKLWPAVGAVLALSGAMAGLSIVMAVISKKLSPEQLGNYKTTITCLIAIAASIASVAIAIKILTSIKNIDHLWKKLAAFIVGFSAFVTAMTIAQKFWGNGMSIGNTAGILFFALSLKKIAKAILFISDIDFSKIQKGLKGFLICVAILAGLAIAFGKSKWHSGANAIGFAISLWMLIIPIKKLAAIDYSHFTKALKDLQGIIITLGIIAGAVTIMGMKCTKGRAAIHATGDFIKALGTALIGMTVSVGILGSMKKSILKKGIACVGLLITFITVSMGLLAFGSQGVKVDMAFRSLMGIVLGVASLVGSVIVLGMIDPGILAKGTFVVGALLTFFGICLKLSSGAKDVKMGPIIAVALACVSLGSAILILGVMPFPKMMQGILGMAAIVGALFALMIGIKGMTTSFSANVKFKTIMVTAIAMLVTVAISVGVLTGVVAKYGVKNMIAACAGMATILLSLAGTFAIMQIAGVTAAGAVVAELVISLAILAMFGLMELIGGLQRIPGAKKNLDLFVNWMEKLGEGFGAVVAGFKKQVDKEKIKYLKDTTDAMTKYIKGIADVDPEVIKAANKSLDALSSFGSNGGTVNYSSIDSEGIKSTFEALGEGVNAFKTQIIDVGGFTDTDVEMVSSICSALSEIIKAEKGIPNSGLSLSSGLLGDNRLDDFLQMITGTNGGKPGLMTTMKTIMDAFNETTFKVGKDGKVKEVKKYTKDSVDMITSLAEALGAIAEASRKIPNSSGHGLDFSLLSAAIGDNRLDDFLQMIAGTDDKKGFAEVFKECADKIGGKNTITKKDVTSIENACKALGAIAEISDEITGTDVNIGVLADTFTVHVGKGDQYAFTEFLDSVGEFGPKIAECAKALKDKKITDKDIENLKSAAEAGVAIATIKIDSHDFSPIDDLLAIFGNDDFSRLLEKMPTVGAKLAAAASAFKDTKTEDVGKMTSVFINLSSLMRSVTMKKSNGGDKLIDINKFAKNLSKSTESFSSFATGVNDIDVQSIKDFSDGIYYTCERMAKAADFQKKFKTLGGALSTVGTGMNSFVSAASDWSFKGDFRVKDVNTGKETAATSKQEDVSALLSSLKEMSNQAKEFDSTAVDYAASVTAHFAKMVKDLKSNLSDAANVVTKKGDEFYNKGKELIGRLISGIAKKNPDLQHRATASVNVFYNKVNYYGKDQMFKAGKYMLEGLIEGLKDPDTLAKVESTSRNVGTKANDAIKKETDERSPSHKWQKYGVYMLMGLHKGLTDRSNLSKLEKSSKSVGTVVDDSIRNRLEIHSPAKTGIRIGNFEIGGIIKGLTNNKAFSALSNGAKMVADVLNGSILGNLNPQKSIDKAMKKFDIKMPNLEKELSKGLSKVKFDDWSKAGKKAYTTFEKAGTKALKGGGGGGITGMDVSTGDDSKKKSGKSGSSGKKGSSGKSKATNSLGKALTNASGLSEKDIRNVLKAYEKVFYKVIPNFDPFNPKYLKKGKNGGLKVTANYIAHSFKSSRMRGISVYFANNLARQINDEFGNYAKKHGLKKGTKAYKEALKKFTHEQMKDYTQAVNKIYDRVEDIGGKRLANLLNKNPKAAAQYAKKFKPIGEQFTGTLKEISSYYGVDKTSAGKAFQLVADTIWETSDEGKENRKNLETSLEKESDIREKMQEKKKIIDQTDQKTSNKKVKADKNSLKLAKKGLAETKKGGTYRGKDYKQWKTYQTKKEKQYKKDKAHNIEVLKAEKKQAKEGMKNTKNGGKWQGKTYKQWKKIYNARNKAITDENNKRTKAVKDLSNLENDLEDQQKTTADYAATEAKGAISKWQELYDAIKSSVKEALKITSLGADSGMSFFQKFSYGYSVKSWMPGKTDGTWNEATNPFGGILESSKQFQIYLGYLNTQIVGIKKYWDDLAELEKEVQSGKWGTNGRQMLDYFKDSGTSNAPELHAILQSADKDKAGMADIFSEEKSLGGKELFEKFMQNRHNMEEWSSLLEKLAKEGANGDLLMDLAKDGYSDDSLKILRYLDSMDDTTFKEFNEKYLDNDTFAKIQTQKAGAAVVAGFTNGGTGITDEKRKVLQEALNLSDTEMQTVDDSAKILVSTLFNDIMKYVSDSDWTQVATLIADGISRGYLTSNDLQDILAEYSRRTQAGETVSMADLITNWHSTGKQQYDTAKTEYDRESKSYDYYHLAARDRLMDWLHSITSLLTPYISELGYDFNENGKADDNEIETLVHTKIIPLITASQGNTDKLLNSILDIIKAISKDSTWTIVKDADKFGLQNSKGQFISLGSPVMGDTFSQAYYYGNPNGLDKYYQDSKYDPSFNTKAYNDDDQNLTGPTWLGKYFSETNNGLANLSKMSQEHIDIVSNRSVADIQKSMATISATTAANQVQAIDTANNAVREIRYSNQDRQYDDRELRHEIQGMRNDLHEYSDNITHLSINLDGKAMVGALTPGIDQALGQRSNMRGGICGL